MQPLLGYSACIAKCRTAWSGANAPRYPEFLDHGFRLELATLYRRPARFALMPVTSGPKRRTLEKYRSKLTEREADH